MYGVWLKNFGKSLLSSDMPRTLSQVNKVDKRYDKYISLGCLRMLNPITYIKFHKPNININIYI